jgi:NTE family protein
MATSLVLGAGGLVGIAHHVGVLAALEEELGLSNDRLDVVVGTSAGSAVAAYLRSGWTPSQLLERAADLAAAAPSPLANSPLGLVRRGLGSAYVIARASIRVPSLLSLVPSPSLRRAFPAGLVSMDDGIEVLERELPRRWPERKLLLAAYDLVSRRRVVLRADAAPYLPLPRAVQASCAIPGIYAPIRVGDHVLVDGGAWSLANLDLVALERSNRVICVAPMSYDVARPPDRANRAVREVATRFLYRQAARLSRQGVKVLLLAPGPREVATQGINLMRSSGLFEVGMTAYEETKRVLAGLGEREGWEREFAA